METNKNCRVGISYSARFRTFSDLRIRVLQTASEWSEKSYFIISALNATMRTINLSCQIVAPFAVGHLLDWFSYVTGAIFIASWNVISAIVEYYLLHAIFSLVPELSNKKATDEAPTWKIVTDAGNGNVTL